MVLHEPFFIGSALAPALKIGDATLTLLEVIHGGRDRAVFEIRTTTGIDYTDRQLLSGYGGFRSTVEIFETFLAFLDAASEAGPDSDNADLFPPHIMEWCAENGDAIGEARCLITNEDGNPNINLIEE